MKSKSGSSDRVSLPDTPTTEPTTYFFFPEWVIGVFYAGHWDQVKEGTFREGIPTRYGDMVVYEDPFNGELTFVSEPITGYRVKRPTPPEPKASVTPLFPDKK